MRKSLGWDDWTMLFTLVSFQPCLFPLSTRTICQQPFVGALRRICRYSHQADWHRRHAASVLSLAGAEAAGREMELGVTTLCHYGICHGQDLRRSPAATGRLGDSTLAQAPRHLRHQLGLCHYRHQHHLHLCPVLSRRGPLESGPDSARESKVLAAFGPDRLCHLPLQWVNFIVSCSDAPVARD